jgi:O-antigen/teichoic acid export membrane protein
MGSNQIKVGALLSYSAIIFNIISGLIYTPWMVNQIGKSDYGLYILVTMFMTYFIMDFGLGQAIARYISKYRSEGEVEKANELLGLTTKLYLLIDLTIFITLIVVFFFISNIFKQLTPEEIQKFRIIYCIAGLFSLLSFPFSSLQGIFIAYERFIFLKLCDLILKISTIILMVIALFMGYKLFALVTINAGIGIIVVIIKFAHFRKNIPIKVNFRYFNKSLLYEIFKFSIWITIIGISQRLFLNITPTILGIFSGTTQIAIFAIGITISGYTETFATALNGLFLPKVTGLAVKKDNVEEITKLMIKVSRIQLFVVGILIIGVITLGKQFVVFWMGPDFARSYSVIVLLIVPGIITLTQEIGNTMLFVVNELKYRAFLFIGASTISVIISIILTPSMGALGAAIGIFIALVLCHVIGINIVYYKILKLNIPRFFRECHLKMIAPFSFSLLSGFLINAFIPAHNLITFLPKAIFLGVVYIIFMWFLGLNTYEKEMIRGLVRKTSAFFKKKQIQ